MRNYYRICIFIATLIQSTSSSARENCVNSLLDDRVHQESSRAMAAEWLKKNPAPSSCPAGFHPESGYWYGENSYFAWSECTKDGLYRDAKGVVQSNPERGE